MISAQDLRGVIAMMPAFATDDCGDVSATQTVDTTRLTAGVKRMVQDGVSAIATTGSFGETALLLANEFEILARATVEAVGGRVPAIIGCVTQNTRETLARVRVAEQAGADAVLVGIPYYFPSTVDNAVAFIDEIARRHPKLGILIYHNPTLHRIAIPVSAFEAIVKNPNVIGMKDSHRTPAAFVQLMDIVGGKISVFVQQEQYYPYYELGASGFWSIDIWMGPEPLLALKKAVDEGNTAKAKEILIAIARVREYARDLSWREMGHKLAIRYAGYVDPGPLRPPFVKVPEIVHAQTKRRAEYWRSLCETYAPAGRVG